MPRGNGFVHLNTPATISYSAGQQLSLSELRQTRRREECVVLPYTVGIWREAFRSFVKAEGLTQFVGDIEAEREGEGPVLPPLNPIPVTGTRKRERPQEIDTPLPPPPVAVAASSSSSESRNVPSALSSSDRGIVIVSHHKLSGERQFVYPDHDGVLSSGVVPQVVMSEEEREAMEANRRHYIAPCDMTEEESAALEELESLWRSTSRSRSMQGAQHRAAVGAIVPGGAAAEEEDEWRGNHGDGNATRTMRRILQPNTHNLHVEEAAGDESSAGNTGDALDDALRLAGELLDFTR